MRILVVDARPHSREGLRDSLAGDGHRVETATDGWEALAKIKQGRFDAAIMDLDLPSSPRVALTGWDFARIFRLYRAGLPIILMAADGSGTSGEPRSLGGVEVLEKPISPARLKTLLRRLDGAAPSPAPEPSHRAERRADGGWRRARARSWWSVCTRHEPCER
jgi:CheY-like chemotaxis protein